MTLYMHWQGKIATPSSTGGNAGTTRVRLKLSPRWRADKIWRVPAQLDRMLYIDDSGRPKAGCVVYGEGTVSSRGHERRARRLCCDEAGPVSGAVGLV